MLLADLLINVVQMHTCSPGLLLGHQRFSEVELSHNPRHIQLYVKDASILVVSGEVEVGVTVE